MNENKFYARAISHLQRRNSCKIIYFYSILMVSFYGNLNMVCFNWLSVSVVIISHWLEWPFIIRGRCEMIFAERWLCSDTMYTSEQYSVCWFQCPVAGLNAMHRNECFKSQNRRIYECFQNKNGLNNERRKRSPDIKETLNEAHQSAQHKN